MDEIAPYVASGFMIIFLILLVTALIKDCMR